MFHLTRLRVALIALLALSSVTPSAQAQRSTAQRFLRMKTGTIATTAASDLLAPARRAAPFTADSAYVLQLAAPITPQQRTALARIGVHPGEYLPDHAYIVRLNGVSKDALAELEFVAWVGAYQDAWKIDSTIGQRAQPFQTPERIALAQQGKYQLSVTLFQGFDLAKGVDQLTAAGAEVEVSELVDGQGLVGVIIAQDRLADLADLPFVQYVEESSEITLRNNSDRWIVQSNVSNVTPFYDAGIHGEGQIVGVVDGKVNVNHCSFSDTNPIGPTHRKIVAYNTSLGSETHGTHVAGTACGDNGVNDNTRGVAYLAKLAYSPIPSFTETAINSTLTTHHGQGARIHTNSWGDDGTTQYNSLCRGFDLFLYNNEESFCCLAVTNQSLLKNPENAKNLLACGASQDTPNQANHCSGGTGPTADGRRKPELYAPGCGTVSANASTSCGTTSLTGTSMATPAIAGAAMLVRQYYTDGYYPTGAPEGSDALTPSGALIKATLLDGAVDMTGISGYPSNQEGWGRVLADNALYFPGDARSTIVFDDIFNANGLSTNEFAEYQFSVSGSGEQLRLTLVFTDAPGTSGASNPVVNNLDLELTDPTGTVVYKGNYFSGGVSVAGGSADAINNVEQIHINSPATGLWTAKVKATAVNQATQGYALIGSGDINLGPLPPVANDVSVETPVGMTVLIQLDATDVDLDPLDFVITSLPSSGTLNDPLGGTIGAVPYTLASNGSVVEYEPLPAFVGSVSFLYHADDGGVPPDGGSSNAALVNVLVKADAPQILTTTLPDGTVNQPYGPEQIQLSGGQPPVTWQIVADVPYIEEDLGTNGFAEVGVAQGWHGDDVRWDHTLPFAFPFYTGAYTQVHIWSNGMIDFVAPHNGSAVTNSDALLMDNRRIAPLWDDLRTDQGSEDIYIDESIPDQVTVRWKAVTYVGAHPVNMAVTLHADGAIDFHYGSGNDPVSPTIGVSNGDNTRFTFASYNNATNLTGAGSIRLRIPDQLSPGLALSSGGELSGTPTQPGDYLPLIRVTDSLDRNDQQAIPLTVLPMLGDFDHDGDVDRDDLLIFVDCLNGPASAPPRVSPPPSEADCLAAFDFDDSTYIDLVDFAALQAAMAP